MYGEELKRACAENSFALESYELGSASGTKAEAVIITLERKELQVELSDAGFKVGVDRASAQLALMHTLRSC